MWVHAIDPESSRMNIRFGFTVCGAEVINGTVARSVAAANAAGDSAVAMSQPQRQRGKRFLVMASFQSWVH
jgi:hypothetical protein